MRYRPFNHLGLSVSVITLALNDAPISQTQRLGLVFAALEAGINSFELADPSPECLGAVRAAIEAAGRDVLVLTLRSSRAKAMGDRPAEGHLGALDAEVRACLNEMGAQRFDAVLLEAETATSPHEVAELHEVRGRGLAGMIGLACGRGGPTLDLLNAGYDVVATPFGLRAEAGLRKRLQTLVGGHITVMGYDFDDVVTAIVEAETPKGLGRLFRRTPPPTADGPYGFLHRTPDWTAEAIALAYALTEPSLATIRVQTTDIATLDQLAKAVERQLPTGAAAQIEMARFSAPA